MRNALIFLTLFSVWLPAYGTSTDIHHAEDSSLIRNDSPAFIANTSSISTNDRHVTLDVTLESKEKHRKYSRIPVSVGLIAVPSRGRISARIVTADIIQLDTSNPKIKREFSPLPEDLVILDGPAVWRELRVVSLLLKPCWDENGHQFQLKHVHITVESNEGVGKAEKKEPVRPISPLWERIYAANILNFESVDVPRLESGTGNRYIIVSRERFEDQTPQFAEWKTRQGYGAVTVTLEDLGYGNPYSREAINATKRFIMEAYTAWEVPPDFVILVGDMYDAVPSGSLYSKQFWDILGFDPLLRYYDQWYALLDGPDLLPDVMLGRFPDTNLSRLDYMFHKSIDYEMNPHIEGQWQKNAIMTAMHSNPGHVTIRTKQAVADSLDAWGMNVEERYNMGSAAVIPLINQGVTFYNYRGEWCGEFDWGGTFSSWDVPYVYNVNKLGIWTILSCSSADIVYSYPTTAELMLRVGYEDPAHPRGAVGFVGSQGFSWYYYNNALDIGFYRAFISEGAALLGEAFISGKAYAYANTTPSDSQRVMLREYTILGDPSIQVWTDVPAPMSVMIDHEAIAPDMETSVSISVSDSASQDPVEDALVCLRREGDVYVYGYTDESGVLNVSLSPQSQSPPGNIDVTITALNMIPFYGSISVTGFSRPPTPEIHICQFDDSGHLILGWKPVPGGSMYYDVFRVNGPYDTASESQLIGTSHRNRLTIPGSMFTEETVYFRIRARNAEGISSKLSESTGIHRVNTGECDTRHTTIVRVPTVKDRE